MASVMHKCVSCDFVFNYLLKQIEPHTENKSHQNKSHKNKSHRKQIAPKTNRTENNSHRKQIAPKQIGPKTNRTENNYHADGNSGDFTAYQAVTDPLMRILGSIEHKSDIARIITDRIILTDRSTTSMPIWRITPNS